MTGTSEAGRHERSVPSADWFDRPVLDVARGLLDAELTSHLGGATVTVRVTEVEAYDGEADPGSHAYRGPNARNGTMFGPAGHLYVYRHLGLHHCANVVAGRRGRASAVLLRAGEVVAGRDAATARRTAAGVLRSERDLARGPARLAVALGLTRDDDGADLLDPSGGLRLTVCDPPVPAAALGSGPRVGVSGPGGDGDAFPWRLWLAGAPSVSDYRAAPTRRRRADGGPPSAVGTAD